MHLLRRRKVNPRLGHPARWLGQSEGAPGWTNMSGFRWRDWWTPNGSGLLAGLLLLLALLLLPLLSEVMPRVCGSFISLVIL